MQLQKWNYKIKNFNWTCQHLNQYVFRKFIKTLKYPYINVNWNNINNQLADIILYRWRTNWQYLLVP